MKKSFWGLIWESFLAVNGLVVGILGVVLAVLLWRFPPNATISLPVVVILGSVCFIAIATLFYAAQVVFAASNQNLPKVKLVKQLKALSSEEETYTILLLSSSVLFSFDSFASIYYVEDDDFERLIALGVVVNIQQNKIIQVEILESIDSSRVSELTNIERREQWKKLRVKPNISRSIIRSWEEVLKKDLSHERRRNESD
ncbi:hypothetical protein Pse7367_3276 [Thalassoporum mexicanum PCC 7367]|uniref:hypothetical protein n=1 Tax=Thalassoporum mexicanum TaxID=3457544 RepID=UPI00029FF278|nr:hypothetical protein [Pseudanabaena sp. PCC 7367]AFY71517.1 hypothetical protein Pse7367_3276 [Pseudanabaena sp. PCC 7367]